MGRFRKRISMFFSKLASRLLCKKKCPADAPSPSPRPTVSPSPGAGLRSTPPSKVLASFTPQINLGTRVDAWERTDPSISFLTGAEELVEALRKKRPADVPSPSPKPTVSPPRASLRSTPPSKVLASSTSQTNFSTRVDARGPTDPSVSLPTGVEGNGEMTQLPAGSPFVETMRINIEDDPFFRRLLENINSLVPPQDATSPSPQNGACIPQKKYRKGAGRDDPKNQNMVLFVREDGSFIPLTAALEGDYTGLASRDIVMFEEAGFTITLRLEWPGYPPQDFQLRTYDWRKPPQRITLSKLAMEVGKVVQQFVERMQGENIASEHAQWRVGPGGIQAKDLRLAALEQVSAGSWQPRLFYKPGA